MVNSPSRPNLRPPAPVECGGMTPLWNRETCLPVHRPSGSHRPQSDQIKPNQTMPPHFVCSRRSRLPSRWPSARTKAKNPAIKANRASSRQTPYFQTTINLANRPAGWGGSAGEWSNRVPRRNPLLGERKQVRASVITNHPLRLPTANQGKNPFNRA